MFKGPAEARAFSADLAARLPSGVDVVVCVPYVSLPAALESGLTVYAQSVNWEPEGAYTGEISPPMLTELGVHGSLVGHSERRQYFGETDTSTARRAQAALNAGLGVIACVGETLEVREAGDMGLCSSCRSRRSPTRSARTTTSSWPTSRSGRSAPGARPRRSRRRRRRRSSRTCSTFPSSTAAR